MKGKEVVVWWQVLEVEISAQSTKGFIVTRISLTIRNSGGGDGKQCVSEDGCVAYGCTFGRPVMLILGRSKKQNHDRKGENMTKRAFSTVIIFAVLLLPAGVVQAESPIYLSHTLTSFTAGAGSVTLGFSLHVVNPSGAPLYNLTLSKVPLTIVTLKEVSLDIGYIEAGGSLDITFSVVTPMLLGQDEFSRQPLFWAGEYKDGGGNLIKFPAESRPASEGGALW